MEWAPDREVAVVVSGMMGRILVMSAANGFEVIAEVDLMGVRDEFGRGMFFWSFFSPLVCVYQTRVTIIYRPEHKSIRRTPIPGMGQKGNAVPWSRRKARSTD